jgi:hypothetical protein
LDKEISEAVTDLMKFISNIPEWNDNLKKVEGDSRVLVLNEIDRLTQEKNSFINYINALN